MGHDHAEEVALFRFSVIAEAVSARLSPAQRGLVVRALAERVWECPDGAVRAFSRATLDRWVRAYRAAGLDGLRPRPRSDAGRARDNTAWLAEAARLRRELPARSSAAIVDAVGRAHGVWLSERTVRAHLAREGLSRAALCAEPARAFGRFEATRPNELWCADVLVGPFVPHPRVAGSRRARLFGLLDDYSRLIVHGRWGPEENTRAGQDVLRAAVCRRGVPEVLLVDNGAPFRARQLARTCAVLGTRLVFAKPYHPATKGKLERFHRYLRERFLTEAMAVGIGSFDELNDRWAAWSETVANHRTHAETGQRPVDRYVAGRTPAIPDPATVFEAFRWSVSRRVSKTATVEFHGNRYGVEPSLVGLWVELRFDPEDLDRIDVYVEGRPAGAATPFVVGRHVHADV
ncbi:MAG TPA: DDE-type integrase/transposase/recombinase, partial [Acidimicrobiales bacterium]|nr:DDE-type integrase/transposase/recombinase [Acidimicrobiales bacterium]